MHYGVLLNTMKMLLLIISLLPTLAQGKEWKVQWLADKGPDIVAIEHKPKGLDKFILNLPSGHPEAEQDIKAGHSPKSSRVVNLGKHGNLSICSLQLEVPQSYYSKYFIIVAEVSKGKFMPLFIHQGRLGLANVKISKFETDKKGITILIDYSVVGSNPVTKTYKVISDLVNPPITTQL